MFDILRLSGPCKGINGLFLFFYLLFFFQVCVYRQEEEDGFFFSFFKFKLKLNVFFLIIIL